MKFTFNEKDYEVDVKKVLESATADDILDDFYWDGIALREIEKLPEFATCKNVGLFYNDDEDNVHVEVFEDDCESVAVEISEEELNIIRDFFEE